MSHGIARLPLVGVDLTHAESLLGNDVGLFCSLLKDLVVEVGENRRTMGGPGLPVDRLKTLRDLHRIKGSAVNLGAVQLGRNLADLECWLKPRVDVLTVSSLDEWNELLRALDVSFDELDRSLTKLLS